MIIKGVKRVLFRKKPAQQRRVLRTKPFTPKPGRLMNQVRQALRYFHYSYSTEIIISIGYSVISVSITGATPGTWVNRL